MRMRVLAGALMTLALAAGCGGSSSSNVTAKFKSGYEQVRDPLNQIGTAIGGELNHASKQSDTQVGAAFKSLATRFQRQLSQLQTLKPPSNLQSDWNSVLDAAGRLETDLNHIVAAAATHSYSAAEQAGASLAQDAAALKSAVTPIKHKLKLP